MHLTLACVALLSLLVHQAFTDITPVRTSLTQKRTSNRAVLAGKLDPDFWPARGRRSDVRYIPFTPHHTIIPWTHMDQSSATARGLNSDEEGPFWANRGRSLDDEEDEVFWAGRGRSLDDFNTNDVLYSSARSTEKDEEPFWANRGRSVLDIEGNNARSMNSGEEDPFWANRGRRQDGSMGDEDERWRKHRLYVEEPGWVWLNRREVQPPFEVTFSGGGRDPFWVARGKRQHKKQKREISCFDGPNAGVCWPYNTKRFSKDYMRQLTNKNQDEFWPMRGKRRLFWGARGRRTDQLSRALEMAKEDHFWPARGKKNSGNQHQVQPTDHSSPQ